MDLATNLIFLVVFGLVGFATGMMFGINIYKVVSDVGTIILLAPFLYLAVLASIHPESAINQLGPIITLWTENLPGIIIGDIAGSIVAAVTGEP